MIRPRRAALSAVSIVCVVLGLVVIRTWSPHASFLFPRCAFHYLTGINCPGCGGTRCLHALLNGHFLEALRDNALIVLALPVAAFMAWRVWWPWVRGLPTPPSLPMKTWVIYSIIALLLGFFVLRNLPWTPFIYLSP